MGDSAQQPVGISLMQLAIANETTLTHQARTLIDRVQQEPIPLPRNKGISKLEAF